MARGLLHWILFALVFMFATSWVWIPLLIVVATGNWGVALLAGIFLFMIVCQVGLGPGRIYR